MIEQHAIDVLNLQEIKKLSKGMSQDEQKEAVKVIDADILLNEVGRRYSIMDQQIRSIREILCKDK